MAEKIKRYKVAKAKANDLEHIVNLAITEGWQPFGHPTFVSQGNDKYSTWVDGYQAMILFESDDDVVRFCSKGTTLLRCCNNCGQPLPQENSEYKEGPGGNNS